MSLQRNKGTTIEITDNLLSMFNPFRKLLKRKPRMSSRSFLHTPFIRRKTIIENMGIIMRSKRRKVAYK